MKNSFIVITTLICLVQAHAQPAPSQAEIKAKTQSSLTDIEKSQASSNISAVKAMDALTGATLNGRQASPADFANLARPGAKMPTQAPKRPASDLMIFVSMSMPEEMLRQYSEQATRFGAVLIMRGFVNDKMSDTREVLAKLNPSGAEWEINPEPFKTFKIDKVPAIVLATAESSSVTEDGCARPETYTAVFGNLAVVDALDRISLYGQKGTSAMAKDRLQQDRAAR